MPNNKAYLYRMSFVKMDKKISVMHSSFIEGLQSETSVHINYFHYSVKLTVSICETVSVGTLTQHSIYVFVQVGPCRM